MTLTKRLFLLINIWVLIAFFVGFIHGIAWEKGSKEREPNNTSICIDSLIYEENSEPEIKYYY